MKSLPLWRARETTNLLYSAAFGRRWAQHYWFLTHFSPLDLFFLLFEYSLLLTRSINPSTQSSAMRNPRLLGNARKVSFVCILIIIVLNTFPSRNKRNKCCMFLTRCSQALHDNPVQGEMAMERFLSVTRTFIRLLLIKLNLTNVTKF